MSILVNSAVRFITLCLLGLAGAAHAQALPRVEPAEVIAAVGDCRTLPDAFDAAEHYVLGHGWERMGADAGTSTFHKGHVGLLLNRPERGAATATGCMVMGEIDPAATWDSLVAAASAAFGGAPAINQNPGASWDADGRTIVLIRQGERQELLTLVVVRVTEGNH